MFKEHSVPFLLEVIYKNGNGGDSEVDCCCYCFGYHGGCRDIFVERKRGRSLGWY